jgi:hypothetical protein
MRATKLELFWNFYLSLFKTASIFNTNPDQVVPSSIFCRNLEGVTFLVVRIKSQSVRAGYGSI